MENTKTFSDATAFIRSNFDSDEGFIGLHEPLFIGNERKYVAEAIDSTFVSSVGKFVDRFEKNICDYTGAQHSVAIVNGTSALHIALLVGGVKPGDLVITQPLTFIATCNAIRYLQADPIFIDIDARSLGLSAFHLREFLKQSTRKNADKLIHKETGRTISACVPMHTFGHPVEIEEIVEICSEYNIPLIEDSAESLGSQYNGKNTGTFGLMGVYSFNGNKTITCGGGGMLVTDNQAIAKHAKHLTTQAKKPHAWHFDHDFIGFNYRMPNINAALGCAQLEMLDRFIESKRLLANSYRDYFKNTNIEFVDEPANTRSNFWLNSIQLPDLNQRDEFLKMTNENKVMTRPSWKLMNKLEMFKGAVVSDLTNANLIEGRLVNIPSSPKSKFLK